MEGATMEGGEQEVPNNDILRLLKYIQLFQDAGALEEEFKAFAEDGEDITTIGQLVRACQDEVSYWADDFDEDDEE